MSFVPVELHTIINEFWTSWNVHNNWWVLYHLKCSKSLIIFFYQVEMCWWDFYQLEMRIVIDVPGWNCSPSPTYCVVEYYTVQSVSTW